MAACRRASSWRKGAPSCAFRGAMQSQPKHEFGRVMQQFAQALLSGQRTLALADGEDGQAVLGDGKWVSPLGSPAPTHGAGKTRGEVTVGPGLRIGVEEIEPTS